MHIITHFISNKGNTSQKYFPMTIKKVIDYKQRNIPSTAINTMERMNNTTSKRKEPFRNRFMHQMNLLYYNIFYLSSVLACIQQRKTIQQFKYMKQNQQSLDAINIIKGISYSQLMLEDLRIGLCQSSGIDFPEVYSQIDTKGLNKVYPTDFIKFLSVHRIAISERQAQYLIYLSGTQNPFMDFENFQYYFSNGDPQYISSMMTKSRSHNRGKYADEMIKNYGQMEISKILQKQIEFYRTLQKLKQQYIKKYGFTFKNVLASIDRQKRGKIDMSNLIQFVHRFGVELSPQEFQALGRRIFSKESSNLTYNQMMRLLSPFEPLNFPTYRKQNNFQKALDYINEQVSKLNINTQPLSYSGQQRIKNTTGFNKIIENYRNPALKTDSLNSKYFYDQNYYNELKQYRTNYFNPNRDVKKKVQTQMIGPQYHDHFFSDYYLYLEQRNKLEHYYNKFGKRYTYDNPLKKNYSNK